MLKKNIIVAVSLHLVYVATIAVGSSFIILNKTISINNIKVAVNIEMIHIKKGAWNKITSGKEDIC